MSRRGVVGLALSGLIALGGLRRESLSRSGAVASVAMGTVTTARGGYARATLLVAFFLSSSGLSLLPIQTRQAGGASAFIARSARRDVVQVLANGGVATAVTLAGGTDRMTLPYIGALAAVTGDTWATEIGSRSPAAPRHLLTGNPVPPGMSGGVTIPGTAASLAGGMFIGVVAALVISTRTANATSASRLIVSATAAGAFGSLLDSLLGATLQERRWCPHCQLSTEQAMHRCGTPTLVSGGVRGLNNDIVNVACSVTGALVGYVLERTPLR